jgi:hypothetical protein
MSEYMKNNMLEGLVNEFCKSENGTELQDLILRQMMDLLFE